jgi:hypothetical protein
LVVINNAYNIPGGKPEDKGPLQGNIRNRADDIKMNLTGNEFECVEDCVLVAQDIGQLRALAKMLMNFNVS